jgi:hypothetical protein
MSCIFLYVKGTMDYSLKEILNIFERIKYPMAGHSGRAVRRGADICLWLSLFHLLVVCCTTNGIVLGWVKEIRTTKS